jgi:hypothetical protein
MAAVTVTRSVRLRVVTLAAAAIALYAPLVGWGIPHATAPDRTKTFATDEILPLEGPVSERLPTGR